MGADHVGDFGGIDVDIQIAVHCHLAKLGDLRGVTDLEINDTDLTRLDTKSQIDVTGDIYIHHNDQLTEIANIYPKSTVETLRIEYNAALTGLGNVSRATVVSGATSIISNAKLAAADLSSAQRLEGGLVIQDNAALTSINLSSLQSVGNLTIARNALLTTVGTMSAMTNVHGTFTVDGNGSLATLGTLGNAILVDLGEKSRAIGIYKQALAIDPLLSEVRKSLDELESDGTNI